MVRAAGAVTFPVGDVNVLEVLSSDCHVSSNLKISPVSEPEKNLSKWAVYLCLSWQDHQVLPFCFRASELDPAH